MIWSSVSSLLKRNLWLFCQVRKEMEHQSNVLYHKFGFLTNPGIISRVFCHFVYCWDLFSFLLLPLEFRRIFSRSIFVSKIWDLFFVRWNMILKIPVTHWLGIFYDITTTCAEITHIVNSLLYKQLSSPCWLLFPKKQGRLYVSVLKQSKYNTPGYGILVFASEHSWIWKTRRNRGNIPNQSCTPI